MGNATKSLRALISNIDAGELVLPEIQRDFVWNKQNVLLLFDSLYRELPIGSMLVWKAKTSVPKKKTSKAGDHIPSFYGYLLDGQQRLMAIKKVRDNDDKYPLLFSLIPRNGTDYDADRFQYASKKNANDPLYVKVSDVLSDNFSPIIFLDKIRKNKDALKQISVDSIHAALSRLQHSQDYIIGIIEFDEDDYRKATELFIRFNSTGKKLNKYDLICSELALRVHNLVESQIKPFSTEYPSFIFTIPFLIQCMTAVHTGKIKYNSTTEIWDGSEDKHIIKSWGHTEKGIKRTIDILTGVVNWNSNQWVPSVNALIPIIYLLSKDSFNRKEKILARKWLLLTSVHAYFSGSVHSTLDNIFRRLRKRGEVSMSDLWDITRKSLPKVSSDIFDTKRKSGAVMSLYISYLRNNNAKDWGEQRSRLTGDVIGYNAGLQIHHFFPESLLRKKGFTTDEINTFANYTIIRKDTNLEISDEEPFKYIPRLNIRVKDLRDQCIPEDRELWKIKNHREFLKERRKLLANSINEYLNKNY